MYVMKSVADEEWILKKGRLTILKCQVCAAFKQEFNYNYKLPIGGSVGDWARVWGCVG